MIGAEDETRLKEITGEIKDRFGTLPQDVTNLIDLTEIRFLARRAGIVGIKYQDGCISTTFHKKALVDTGEIVALVSREPERYGVSPDGTLKFTPSTVEIEGLLNSLRNLLHNLAEYVIF